MLWKRTELKVRDKDLKQDTILRLKEEFSIRENSRLNLGHLELEGQS